MTLKQWTFRLSLTNLFMMRICEAAVRKETRKIIVDTFDIYCNFPWKNIKPCTFLEYFRFPSVDLQPLWGIWYLISEVGLFKKTWYKIIYSSEIFFQQSTRHSLFWSIHSWKTLKIVCNVYINLVCHRALNLFIFNFGWIIPLTI